MAIGQAGSCCCRNGKVTLGPDFPKFWLRIRVQKKNAESCRSRLRQSGSGPTSGGQAVEGHNDEGQGDKMPNHCGRRRKVPTMSQVLSSIQYICFSNTSGSNMGGAKLASCPGPHLTSLRPCWAVTQARGQVLRFVGGNEFIGKARFCF